MASSGSSPSALRWGWPRARTTRPSAANGLLALWVVNRKVYGARKLTKAARRAGHEIGRDQVARLMRELGVRSARAVSDAVWMRVLLALWVANRKVYGARKLWKAARRAGHEIGRDQVRPADA